MAAEHAAPVSRRADRAIYGDKRKVRDTVRSSNPSRNRYSHSAKQARMLHVVLGKAPARPPEGLPAALRHKVTAALPRAELVPHCTGEPHPGPPERRAPESLAEKELSDFSPL
jgi:hypothetical protein